MKTNLIIFVFVLLADGFQLKAALSTNSIPLAQESWEIISNRWGSTPLNDIKQAAIKGDVSAQYYYGSLFKDGSGVSVDWTEAFKWISMAAEQGSTRAQRVAGWMYEHGLGTETNSLKAEIFYRKAAEAGDARSQFFLGCLLQYGGAKETNFTEAAVWYKKSAEQTNPDAQMNLGWMYEHGAGVAQDYAEAARLYRLAAEQGHAMAQNNLGWLIANGQGAAKDYGEAQNWFQKAAANGNGYATNNLTWLDAKVFDEQYSQARKYQNGDGVPKDLAEAFGWMKKASQHDSTQSSKVGDAVYYLALMYKNGEGTATNSVKAHELLLQAAYEGQPDACYWAGMMFETGDGVPQDYYLASIHYYQAVFNFTGRRYFTKAADCLLKLYAEGHGLVQTSLDVGKYVDSDHVYFFNRELADKNNVISSLRKEVGTATGEFYLGKIYEQGTLVPQDLTEAAARYQIAANENMEDARKCLTELNAKLSAEQKTGIAKRIQEMKMDLDFARSREDTAINFYHW